MSNDYAGTWIIIIIANIYYLCTENNINYLKKIQNISYLKCKYAVIFKRCIIIIIYIHLFIRKNSITVMSNDCWYLNYYYY